MERRSGGNFRSDEDLYEVKASIESAIAGLSPELRDLAQRLMQERRSRVRRDLGWPRRKFVNSVAVIRKHFEGAGLTGI
jgi:hypothetical protein